MTVLDDLAALVREDGGLLAGAVVPAAAQQATPLADLVAGSPRAAGHPAGLELVVEAVHEGYLLHYGTPRIVAPEDPDLALLAGDRLYALGLERLAAAGDIAAVRALADVIALCAQSHATQDGDLAAAVWEAGASEVGWGGDEALDRAKAAARTSDAGAAEALRGAARALRR